MKLQWDALGERYFRAGVDRGALYIKDGDTYEEPVAWNGLTAINESPSGAEPTALYADNIKYLNLISAEDYGLTIEAYTYPDEFERCDGMAIVADGVMIGQQERKQFGLSYRELLGSDTEPLGKDYIIHLIYNCTASPAEKNHNSINDSPEAENPSWTVSTIPVAVEAGKFTSHLMVFTKSVPPKALKRFEDMLYGTEAVPGHLPDPIEAATALTSRAIYPALDLYPSDTVFPQDV